MQEIVDLFQLACNFVFDASKESENVLVTTEENSGREYFAINRAAPFSDSAGTLSFKFNYLAVAQFVSCVPRQ